MVKVIERGKGYKYCPWCGGMLARNVYRRLACRECDRVLYENPIVGVAAIILDPRNYILLGKRKGSYRGKWCIPCGYVEYEEEIREALIREIKEETNLDITISRLFAVYSNFHDPENHSVGVWFLVNVVDGELAAGDDLESVHYFPLSLLPPLAFPTDKQVISDLRRFLLPQEQDKD